MAKRRQADSVLNPTISRSIVVILLVLAALIITLSFFGKAGVVGIMLDKYVLSFLFGSIRYTVPALILIISWYLARDAEYTYRPAHGLGSVLFFISLSGLMHVSYPLERMWSEALQGNGGGVAGMCAWIFKNYFGPIASIAILISLGIVSLLLLLNISIQDIGALWQHIWHRTKQAGTAGLSALAQVTPRTKEAITIQGDYAPETDEAGVDEENPRGFLKKNLAETEDEDEEEVEETDDDEEDDEDTEPEKNNGDVWSKKVIIKNLPPLDLLSDKRGKPTSGDIEANADIIHDTFEQFGIEVAMGEVRVGPTVTQYTMKPGAGVKLSRITDLTNNLALALAAHPIRIEAPIPGKSLIGVEVPNQKTALVSFRELLEDRSFRERAHGMMLVLGKDVAGKVWFGDLPRLPHLLIAGATGSGKTVCVNTIIMGLLFQNTAETLRFIMVDPKRVELTLYNGIPHLLTPVITNVQKTVNALKWTIGEMERRFEVLASVGSRDITSYNQKNPEARMPHIVFVIDELADLMASAANEIEAGIIRLAQMARAVGIHLIVATQRPSVDVITGLMKANIPGRIAFSVASSIDSRTILDSPGAEKLLGRGDMLYSSAELSKPVRIQGAYISEEEMKRVVDYLKGDAEPEYDESIVGNQPIGNGGTGSMFGGPTDEQDPLFEEAKRYIIQAGKASASLLQRRLKIGYARAARILDELEQSGIIGPGDGAKPREILAGHDDMGPSGTGTGQELNVFSAPKKDEPDSELDDTEEAQDKDEELFT